MSHGVITGHHVDKDGRLDGSTHGEEDPEKQAVSEVGHHTPLRLASLVRHHLSRSLLAPVTRHGRHLMESDLEGGGLRDWLVLRFVLVVTVLLAADPHALVKRVALCRGVHTGRVRCASSSP